MSYLAIETTGAAATVALMDSDGNVFAESGEERLDHLRGLMPMVEAVTAASGTRPQEIEMIAVSAGPGSFTGIRIGLAAARALAQVLDVPVAPVVTLYALACNDFAALREGGEVLLVPLIDARRAQVYGAAYRPGEPEALVPADAYPVDALVPLVRDSAQALGYPRVLFCGDGADAYQERIQALWAAPEAGNCGPALLFAEGPEARQNAGGVLRAGIAMRAAGQLVSYDEARAVYLRKAEAERKRETGRLGRRKKQLADAAAESEAILELPPADGRIRYERLGAEQLDSLAALDELCFAKSWGRREFAGDLEGSRPAAYAGAYNSRGELIGFAGIVYLLDDGEVNRVAVHPLYRARGIAGECLERAMQAAREAGVATLTLEVREANRSAISLYKEHGFRVISKRKNYYKETGENALIMQRTEGGSV